MEQGELIAAFRQRAHFEAERYGTDRWVFVRELLQNARDAGARQVWIGVEESEGRERISCRDDGSGMSFDHARRYLFTLYASSKRDQAKVAGRFGIGFWSVLRYAPELIAIRSRPEDGEGWEVTLDGALERATHSQCVMLPGTEIVLERPAVGGDIEAAIAEAVAADARYLRCRDDAALALEVTVNGCAMTAEFGLPAPSMVFARPGLRGAVALSDEPMVELFAHGLRVRNAAFLDELLLAGDDPPRPTAALPDGLVPRIMLDSDRLQVLMARGEAREDRVVRRMVALARRELNRLVGSVLDRQAPRGRVGRAVEWLARTLWRRPIQVIAIAILVGGVLGVAGGFGLRSLGWIGSRPSVADGRVVSRGQTATSPDAGVAVSLEPYRDLRQFYGGPSVSALDPKSTVALRYRPPQLSPLFATLRLTGLDDSGPLIDEGASDSLEPYRGAPCDQECLEVELELAAPAGILRLPVVTGHLIDIDSVTLDGRPIELFLTRTGEPAAWLVRDTSGLLRYRSAPAPDSTRSQAGAWPKLPAVLARQADSLLALPVPDRVGAAIEQVRSRIAYDRSPAVADRHQQESRKGIPLYERSIAIGAGDCDIQNAVLAAMLARSGIQARLAVGYAGAGGRVLPGLHAWVEYQDGGRWQVADASAGEVAVPEGLVASDPSAIPSEPSSDPAPVLAGRTASKPSPGLIAVATVLGFAGLATALLLVSRRRSRRSLSCEGDADLARLLRGALLRPEAYRDVGSLYSRPLVPLVDGSRVSLTRLRRSVAAGRVYRSDQRSDLALSAAGRGVLVIDAASDEGRVVAGLFGIPDLDRWDGVIEEARSTEVTRLLEEALRRLGERWRVLLASDAPEMVAVLDGRPFGERRGTRLVVVDRDSRLGRFVEGAGGRLHQAVLLLGDAVVQVAEMAPLPRQRLLVDLARRAVAEETR